MSFLQNSEQCMSSHLTRETAADLAAVAALLEITEGLGLSPLLDRPEPFTLGELAEAGRVPESGAAGLLEALLAAGLVHGTHDQDKFVPCDDMADRRYESGYLSWALNANRPYVENAPELLRDPAGTAEKYQRDGRRVAVSSRWVGSKGFYPAALSTILECRPHRIADLGAGAGALVINVLRTLPGSSGVVLDMSAAACVEAGRAAARAGVGDRFEVVHRRIESLVDDPSPVAGADLVHAGFVLHDVVAEAETFDAVLRSCRKAMSPAGKLVVTDAIPYSADPRERKFSALFTYLHAEFMGVRLPTEQQWTESFRAAGFTDVTCVELRLPTARMFVATA
jgi:SAM-dependent methyltransferase